jgi:TetR/AcrR family transcriptional regulator, cholesterol catabolism regulator
MSDREDDAKLTARRADPRYQRLMAATREAAKGGYDAVSMRELAMTTHMSLTSIYQFCPSKDQLIAEAHADRMQNFQESLIHDPPLGDSVEKRVLAIVRAVARTLARDSGVNLTLMRAFYSIEPTDHSGRRSVRDAFASMIDRAMGDAEIADRQAYIETLGHVINSVIFEWVNGRTDAATVGSVLERAVHVLFGDR